MNHEKAKFGSQFTIIGRDWELWFHVALNNAEGGESINLITTEIYKSILS